MKKYLILLFLALEPQDLVLSLTKLIPGCGHLEFHLVAKPLSFLQICFCDSSLLLQFLFLPRQFFQFVGSGQNACFLIGTAAGHGTTRVHDLTVQGDDLKSVFILLGHMDGRIHIGYDHRSSQQIFHNAAVLIITFHQLRCNAHKSTAASKATFL